VAGCKILKLSGTVQHAPRISSRDAVESRLSTLYGAAGGVLT
jgi:hypothetical protein